MLVKCGYTLPNDGGLLNEEYYDMTAEAVYDLIPDPPMDWVCIGEVSNQTNPDGSEMDDSQVEAAEREAKIQVNRAIEAAKACGKVPGALKEFFDEFAEPKVPWWELLRKKMISNDGSVADTCRIMPDMQANPKQARIIHKAARRL